VRLSGIVDVPVYSADGGIGYAIRPNQSGRFLDKNAWAFNDRGMPIAANWNPSLHPNLLLIGNSVIMGGNPYDQSQKVTPLLQQQLGPSYSVWPLAIGGWTNVNESVYLERNPDVAAKANFFIWEYMSGGLSGLSRWRGDSVFPTHKPLWATWYVFERYVAPRFADVDRNELPPTGRMTADNLALFEQHVTGLSRATGSAHPGVILLYPTEKEYLAAQRGEEWLPERDAVQRICGEHGLLLVDLAKSPAWNATLYRDGTHPTAEGNRVLASVLKAAVERELAR
jgi:hypothetical protein